MRQYFVKQYFWLIFLIGLIYTLALNGALPFISTPTLGQAVWITGFSHSYLNQSLAGIYANNIGYPQPAAIAFGLAGSYLSAIYINFGLHAADAYSAMIASWLIIAFIGAYRLARFYLACPLKSILSSVVWCTMPMILKHSGYSMLSIGFALLPFYFLVCLRLFSTSAFNLKFTTQFVFLYVAPYLLICILSVFIDGYSFMMFASGASIIGLFKILQSRVDAKSKYYLFAIHCVSFFVAYILYYLFLGKSQFDAAPLDFFRGWGVDITFWLIPSRGVHWLFDALGLSIGRSDSVFFGDQSVWETGFLFPCMISALVVFSISLRQKEHWSFVFIALFGFYMSLGPSVKFNSTKPDNYSGGPLMKPEYAFSATGSAVFSSYLPGFKNMRASYRWGALGLVGLWVLIIMGLSSKQNKNVRRLTTNFLFLIAILNLPGLKSHWDEKVNNHKMFYQIDESILNDLKNDLRSKELVAFLPWSNDFLVNYLASKLDVYTFNIGGDKNFTEARKNWPVIMQEFPMASVDEGFADRVQYLLTKKEADVVVLPYIDLLWAAHSWPPLLEIKKTIIPVISQLREFSWLDIKETHYYATIRLKNNKTEIRNAVDYNCKFAKNCLSKNNFSDGNVASIVGKLEDGILHTSYKNGFLLFGQYKPLEAGSYRLTLKGKLHRCDNAFVDVVSNKGKIVHAKYSLKSDLSISLIDGIILDKAFIINDSDNDFEVRVIVGNEDKISITGYTLIKID